jgi:hypothetical protein
MRHSAVSPKRAGAGRRTLLTPELQTQICAFIRAGTYDYVAAEASGISRRTLFEWLERGERPSKRGRTPVYERFALAIRRAQAEARVSAEVTVKKGDPKWWLSRMHRERPDAPGWNDTRSVEVTGKDGKTLIPIEALSALIDQADREDAERVRSRARDHRQNQGH